MRRALLLLVAVPTALLADPTLAPAPLSYTQLPDARQEAAAQALMQTIRCVVCQGQSIADSDADLAGDMRALVRQRIAAGETPQAIRAWLIARYGRWVSYQPAIDAMTWPLWAAPIVLLGLGWLLARTAFRRRRVA
ncbi:cytochrome c-type biogenesis protein [Sphingomonas abietis]|uniref:Cytochrome c-type biogenesis protein n=1 Tax=Sphingomonas abietis TaxID=3012344 RepID=A0ABY7NTX3_9SPHN|nr:cytochrome c-type biogenesis protein [Sphingomonas abietis]WBO24103.1 cytochrome c-type biogenesis protein CcmH [Sphingomonas abietis]